MKQYKDLELNYRPDEIDTTSSKSTVYIRENIREIESLDEYDNSAYTMYEYDEIQMTHDEYKVYQLEQELINASMATISMYESSISTLDIEAPSPYIVKVYKSMVDRGILDISEVPFKVLNQMEVSNA